MLDKSDKVERIKSTIATFPNFPKNGILFYDIMPILSHPEVFKDCIDVLSSQLASLPKVDAILALESRGFLFGPTLAMKHSIPFIPIRKAGKLPGPTKKVSYSLEYGEDSVEVQDGIIKPGWNVVIVDDLLATGGTLAASIKLVKSCRASVALSMIIIELKELHGKSKLDSPIYSMIQY